MKEVVQTLYIGKITHILMIYMVDPVELDQFGSDTGGHAGFPSISSVHYCHVPGRKFVMDLAWAGILRRGYNKRCFEITRRTGKTI